MLIALAIAATVIAAPLPLPKPAATPAPQNGLVVLDGNAQFQPVRAKPADLPSDDALARIKLEPELVRLARSLDGDAFAEREAARVAIIARKPTPEELMALLLRKDLGDEARHTLVRILRDRILSAPRGALGIRMETIGMGIGGGAAGDGVRITGLVPGMPAERVLQVGDIVRSVNGTPLRTNIDLTNAVQAIPPGGEVKLVVRRVKRDAAGKAVPAVPALAPAAVPEAQQARDEIEVSVRLGSTDDLAEKGDPQLAPGVLGGGVAIGLQINAERSATADAATKRFLPKVKQVAFSERVAVRADRPAPTIDSVRKLLMELQLGGGDADLVRVHRTRLDALAQQFQNASITPESRKRLQQSLEALETEILGSF